MKRVKAFLVGQKHVQALESNGRVRVLAQEGAQRELDLSSVGRCLKSFAGRVTDD